MRSGLGQPPGMNAHGDPRFANYEIIPAWYVISIELAGAAGSQQTGSVPLRPETFVCYRITWATTGDVVAVEGDVATPCNQQGRSIECLWGDEFTRFMGTRPALLSAIFGDSEGFLDIPEGLQFQGRQTLEVTLTRVLWPTTAEEVDSRVDLVFHGIGLLPKGTHESGTPR